MLNTPGAAINADHIFFLQIFNVHIAGLESSNADLLSKLH